MKILNKKIHYFNPGHENAVWTNNPHYTPPASVCKLMTDLALLPLWYGNDKDYVIINETDETFRFLMSLPACIRPSTIPISPAKLQHCNLLSEEPLEAAPWGLSPHSIRFFETLIQPVTPTSSIENSIPTNNILIPRWNDTYKNLTGRQTTLHCLSKIRPLLPKDFETLTLPRFCSTTDEIRQFMAEYPPPYILKTPYSCSGRGLHRIQTHILGQQDVRRIEGFLKKQKTVSIERALDKVCDFAMGFESDGAGHVRFKGLSVFNTSLNGTYAGNLLGNQDVIAKHIVKFIPKAYLGKIQDAVTSILTEALGFDYQGFLGVDMLIYRKDNTYAVHPFIEINVRYTMGLVALQLNNRIVHPSSRGQLVISCNTTQNKTYNTHLYMKTKYPLQLSDSKIHSGYLSLCPIKPETNYSAYILIEL